MTLTKKFNKKYTYKDYLTWQDDERWELVSGEAFNMTPAPGFKHQNIAGRFYNALANKLSGKLCIPVENYVEKFILIEGQYEGPEILGPREELTLNSLKEIKIQLLEVFEVEEND